MDSKKEKTTNKSAESIKKKKRRRHSRVASMMLVVCMVILMITMSALIVSLKNYRELRRQNLEYENAIKEAASIKKYTQEEVNALVKTASENAATNTQISIKDYIKKNMSSANASTAQLLREMFPENLVYYTKNGYVFAPIYSDIPSNPISNENFIKNENGVVSYSPDTGIGSEWWIDVSSYQGKIDWSKVKEAGVDGVMLRAGYRGYGSGKLVLDDNFVSNMKAANENGITVGAYFFSQAINADEAVEEYNFIIENLGDGTITGPIAIDVEVVDADTARGNQTSTEDRTSAVIAFCEAVRADGYKPLIYGNTFGLVDMLDITRIKDYEFWFAYYSDTMYFPYKVYMWQYTDKGTVDGIKGSVDMSIHFIYE